MLGVIQARLGSTRLPGKVLMEIKGKPLLQYCIERVALACDQVLVLCPSKDFREIWRACSSRDVEIKGIPGDENDVLMRFIRGVPSSAGQIVRICGDSPLIDPKVIELLMERRTLYNLQINSNTRPNTWPAGQCVETFLARGLHMIDYGNLKDGDMEHVTPFMYRNWLVGHIKNPEGNFGHISQVVDTQEDFDRIKAVIEKMERPHTEYGWHEIMELME